MINFIEGWSTYANRAESLLRWAYQAQGNGGTLSNGGMLMNGSVVSYCNARIRPLSRIRWGFKHKCLKRAPSVTNSSFLHLTQGGETNSQNQIGLGMNPNGTVSIFYGMNFSGLGGVTLGNGATVLDVGSEHWIELDVLLALDNTGSVELRIDGVPELVFSGIRTSARATPVVDRVSLVAAGGAQHWFGSMYVGDGDDGWMGSSAVYLLPVAQLSIPVGSLVAGSSIEALSPVGV